MRAREGRALPEPNPEPSDTDPATGFRGGGGTRSSADLRRPFEPMVSQVYSHNPPPLPLCGNNSRNPLRQLRAFLVRVWDGSICNPTHSPPADPPSRTSHRAPRLGGRRSVRRSQRCRAPSFRSGPHRLHLGAPTSGLKRVDEKKR